MFGTRKSQVIASRFDASPAAGERHLPARLLLIATLLLSWGRSHMPGGSDPSEASPLAEALWLVAYSAAFIGLIGKREMAVRLVRASLPLVLIVILAGLSAFWSDEPATTARRALGLLGSSVLALFFVCRLGLKGIVETVGLAVAIAAALSLPLIMFAPDIGIMVPGGEWQGYFVHKNGLGLTMVFGALSAATLLEGSRGAYRAALFAALVLFGVLLIGSRHTAGMVLAVVLAGFFFLLLRMRAERSGRPALLAAGALSAVIIMSLVSGFDAGEALNLLGKDASLSGRTDVWSAATEAINERPVLGYGYSEFSNSNGDLERYREEAGWDAYSAHNGFLQVAVELGAVGEAILIAVLVLCVVRSWRTFWRGNDRLSMWPLLAALCVIFANLTEATFATYHEVSWIIFVSAFLLATDACQRRRAAERLGRDPRSLRARDSMEAMV
jgi:O-antigen ligase